MRDKTVLNSSGVRLCVPYFISFLSRSDQVCPNSYKSTFAGSQKVDAAIPEETVGGGSVERLTSKNSLSMTKEFELSYFESMCI